MLPNKKIGDKLKFKDEITRTSTTVPSSVFIQTDSIYKKLRYSVLIAKQFIVLAYLLTYSSLFSNTPKTSLAK